MAGRALGRGRYRSTAKKRDSASHSTPTTAAVGRAISPAKREKERPLAGERQQVPVRFDTGSSSELEFARWEHA